MSVERLAEAFDPGFLSVSEAVTNVASQIGLAKFASEFGAMLDPVGHRFQTENPGLAKAVRQGGRCSAFPNGPYGVNKRQACPFLPRGPQIP